MLNRPDDEPTFYSKTWRTTTTPDLAVATDDIARIVTTRAVSSQLGGTDHRPVILNLDEQYTPNQKREPPRWNFKKANWGKYEQLLENANSLTSKTRTLISTQSCSPTLSSRQQKINTKRLKEKVHPRME